MHLLIIKKKKTNSNKMNVLYFWSSFIMHGRKEAVSIKYVRKTYFFRKIYTMQIDVHSPLITDFRITGNIKEVLQEVHLLLRRADLPALMDHNSHQTLNHNQRLSQGNSELTELPAKCVVMIVENWINYWSIINSGLPVPILDHCKQCYYAKQSNSKTLILGGRW